MDVLRKEFLAVWSTIVDEIITEYAVDISDPESLSYLRNLLELNVPFGKQTRAMLSIYMYNCLHPENRTTDDDQLSCIGGWIIEILQASALMTDDLMDMSETRRGNVCWYRQQDIGNNAIFDAILLENISKTVLARHCLDKSYFVEMASCSDHNTFRTVLGQGLDMQSAITLRPQLSNFTNENYDLIVKYKTSLYTFFSPIIMSMIRSEITDPELYEAVEDLTVLVGNLFQSQDDFLDCFGNSKTTGKIGTDIKDRKCTWLIVKALEIANKIQKECLLEKYGNANEEEKVKDIYNQMKMKKLFREFEGILHDEIKICIDGLPDSIPIEPFSCMLDAIFRREK